MPRFSGGRLDGDVLLDGVSVVRRPPRERAHVVGYVGQDPAAGFVTDTVEEELAYGMEQLGLPADTMRRRVEETLDLLGIADLRHRDLRTLSGGQQQRVAIGSVLTMHPRLLVLDEPTSALDPTAAEDVLATLTRLVHDLGVSVLLAEHRLERVVPVRRPDVPADRRRPGRRSASPRELLATSPVVPPIVELGRAAGWSPLPLSVRDARRRARGLRPACAARRPRRRRAGRPTAAGCEARGAHGRARPDGRRSATSTSRSAARRVTALMGRNGSGKSSLLWALQGSGRRRARAGRGSAASTRPASTPPPGARLVGLVPQNAADLLYLETVDEECAAADGGSGDCRAPPRPAGARHPRTTSHPRDLSEGQRLALALALVLVARAAACCCSTSRPAASTTPPSGCWPASCATWPPTGHAVLVATHDVEFVAQAADDVVVLAEGEVVSSGPVRRVVAESPAFAPQVTKVLGAAVAARRRGRRGAGGAS